MFPISLIEFKDFYRQAYKNSLIFDLSDKELYQKYSYAVQTYMEDLSDKEKHHADLLYKVNLHYFFNFLGIYKEQYGFIEETKNIRIANRFLEVLYTPSYIFEMLPIKVNYKFNVFILDYLSQIKMLNNAILQVSYMVIFILPFATIVDVFWALLTSIISFSIFFSTYFFNNKLYSLKYIATNPGIKKYKIIMELYPDVLSNKKTVSFLKESLDDRFLSATQKSQKELPYTNKIFKKLGKIDDHLFKLTFLGISGFNPFGIEGKKFISEYSNINETNIKEYYLISAGFYLFDKDKEAKFFKLKNSLKGYDQLLSITEKADIDNAINKPEFQSNSKIRKI